MLIIILLCLNLLGIVWLMMILNNGFSFTNKNIDNMGKKSELLVQRADEVIGKYKRMMQDIHDSK